MAVVPAKLPLWRRAWLLPGRVRRFYLGVVRRGYVRRQLELREGECLRCGACCQMGIRCPSLMTDDDLAGCERYQRHRPLNCGNFPIDERDLRDRDFVAPHQPCGYRFPEKPDAGRTD